MKIAVAGAGVAGLTAALRLARRGHAVEVFEKSDHPGGLAAGFPVGGTTLERYYHHLFLSDTAIRGLVEELGLTDRLHWFESRMGFAYRGRLYPFGTPSQLLRFDPLPLWERVWFGLTTLYLGRVKDWRRFEAVTAADWMRRHAGPNVWRVVWEPLLRGKFGSHYDQVAMAWLWARIHVRAASRGKGGTQEKLGYFRGGFDVFHAALAEAARASGAVIHLNRGVDRILTRGGKFTGLEAGGRVEPFDRMIFAAATPILLKTCPDLPADYRERMTALPFLGAQCLILSLKRSFSDLYWINVADPDIPILALIEHTNFAPPEWYGGRHLMYVGNYLEHGHRYFNMDKEALLEEFLPHLKRINPDFESSWVEESWLFQDLYAQPVVPLHYSRIKPGFETPVENLYLANMALVYPQDRGTNYAVDVGNQVARLLDPAVEFRQGGS